MLTFVVWLVIGFFVLWIVAAYVTLRLILLAQRLDREYRSGRLDELTRESQRLGLYGKNKR